jgi:hypothetical protein
MTMGKGSSKGVRTQRLGWGSRRDEGEGVDM